MQADMPNELKAVIFDLDGVLFDSKPSNTAFYNHILDEMGLPPMGPQDVEVIHRESSTNSFLHLVGEGEPFERAMNIWQAMDPAHFIPQIKLYPHARRCLELLGRKVDLAVATNRAATARLALEHFGFLEMFKVVITPIVTGVSKPDTKFMHACLQGLGCTADQVVYVGDTTVDEELCIKSGVRMIAFKGPELQGWAHVDDLMEIPKLLGLTDS